MTTTRKRGHGTSDRVVATSLSVAACISLVGVVGLREANADVPAEEVPQQEAVSGGGYTQEDLDAYAVALADQAQELADYRAQLDQVAQQLSLRINLAQPEQVAAQAVVNSAPKTAETSRNNTEQLRKRPRESQPAAGRGQ